MSSRFFENELLSRVPKMCIGSKSDGIGNEFVLQSFQENITEKFISPRIEKILHKIKLMDAVIKKNPGIQITEETNKELDRIFNMD